MAGASALAVCALLLAPAAPAAASSGPLRRQFVLQADADLADAGGAEEELQAAAPSQALKGARHATALVDAAGSAELVSSGEGAFDPAARPGPGDVPAPSAAVPAGAPPVFFQVNATKATVHHRRGANATHRGRGGRSRARAHRARGAAPATGAAPGAALGHGAARASGARASLVRREPRPEVGGRNGTDGGSGRPPGLLGGLAEVLFPGDEGAFLGESSIVLLVFMVFVCLSFGTRLGSAFAQHSPQADAALPQAAGQASAAAAGQGGPRSAEDALLAVDALDSVEAESSRADALKPAALAAPSPKAASAWHCIAAQQPRAATEALELCSVPAVERLLPTAGGYDCTLSRPLSSQGPVRLQARVECPRDGLPALTAPLTQRQCVLFSAAASRQIHGGVHPVTVAFEARHLDFVVVLADAPYESIDVVGAEVSLFDMKGGKATSALALEASPGHYQDFVDRCRAGPVGWQRTGAAPRDEGASLEFEECALVVGAHVTLVGELLRDASGRLLLQPPQVAGEELWRTSWERAGAGGAGEACGPLLGKVLVSDDPALLHDAPAEA